MLRLRMGKSRVKNDMIEKKRENSGENIHLASLIIKHGQNSKSSEKGAKGSLKLFEAEENRGENVILIFILLIIF